MPIKLENVGIAVHDLDATIAFFTDLGLTVLGRDTVSGEWADTAVGLDGNHVNIAMLQTPDGHGRLELFEYIHPTAIDTAPTRPNEIGMHRVAFSVDDIDDALAIAAKHGCHPLRGVATYEDVYKLTYVRGPSGIIVMLAQELSREGGDARPGLNLRYTRAATRASSWVGRRTRPGLSSRPFEGYRRVGAQRSRPSAKARRSPCRLGAVGTASPTDRAISVAGQLLSMLGCPDGSGCGARRF